MTTTKLPELGHVRELVESGLCTSIEAAEGLLSELGVRCVQGVFSRSALVRALDGTSSRPDEKTIGEHGHDDEVVHTLQDGLARFGLRLASFNTGRTKFALIAAVAATRTITVETDGERLTIDSSAGVRARVYVASERRTGQAYFLAGGYETDLETKIYLFVLPSEGRFWIARREDLAVYDTELRTAAKRQRGRRRYGDRSGFSPHTARKGYLRVSVHLGGLPALEPHLRIADEDGTLYRHREAWIGGRPQ